MFEKIDEARRRFTGNVVISEGGCWLWTGSTKPGGVGDGGGYGRFQFEGRRVYAHRASWFLFNGAAPAGKLVTHGPCHDRRCVNPRHLKLATHRENTADRRRDGTYIDKARAASRLPGGLGRLDEAQVREIRETASRWAGSGYGERRVGKLAGQHGVTEAAVYHILRNHTWRFVDA